MNHNDIIEFDGKDITVEDILKKQNKVILLQLYIKTQTLDSRSEGMCKKIDGINTKIDNQWKNIGKNKIAISWIRGVLFVSLPLISALIGYLAYTR